MNNKSAKTGDIIFFILMILPVMVLFLGIIFGPIVTSLGMSFTNWNFRPGQEIDFVGLKHFSKIFSDPVFWKAFNNNMAVVGISVFGQIPLGLAFAYFLFRGMVKFKGFFQAMVFFPQVISTVIFGKVFKNLFSVRGALTQIVRNATDDPNFLFTWWNYENQAMVPILITMIFIYTGTFMLMFLANMQKMDSGIVEAAAIDGANEFQIFTRIIVPALAGIIVVNAILAISGSLKSFDLVFAMAPNDGRGLGDNNMLLATYMYHKGFIPSKFAFGSAMSVIIVTISVVLIIFSNWVGRKLNPLQEA